MQILDAKVLKNIIERLIASWYKHIHLQTTNKWVSLYGFTRLNWRIVSDQWTTNYLLSHEISTLDKLVCPQEDLSTIKHNDKKVSN